MDNEWAQLVDYPKYAAHPDGHIKNLESGCVVSTHLSKKGYRRLSLSDEYGCWHTETLHILIARAFLGEAPLGHTIDHIDRNKANNKLSNLKYITSFKNSSQGAEHVSRFGQGHWKAKITNEQVKAIRYAASMGIEYKEIAKKYPLSHHQIRSIASKRAWSHV